MSLTLLFSVFDLVFRRWSVLLGFGIGVRSLLLPQHHAHSPLPQQTDGPRDGLTNNFAPPHTLQHWQESPSAQQACQRLLGHPVVPGQRMLGLKGSTRCPLAWTWVCQLCEGRAWGGTPSRLSFFNEDPFKSLMLPVIFFFKNTYIRL